MASVRQILSDCEVLLWSGNPASEVSLVTADSREIKPGALFVAVPGYGRDGHDFIASAVEKGATAIVYEKDGAVEGLAEKGITLAKVASSRKALAAVASAWYGHPSRKLKLCGITGTNGKTTTVTLLYRLFTALGYHCGMLSTIANYVGSREIETVNTTSDPLTTNRLLARMAEEGCQYCFMEASSIGIEQDRVSGLDFDVAIFSNLTHDHLDYHKTFAEYIRCKKLFFDALGKKAVAIINADDKNGSVMVQNTAAKVVTYALRSAADHRCKIIEEGMEGMELQIDGSQIWTRLIGRHNAYNILAAYCAALELGAGKEETLVALSSLESAKGRLEVLHGPKGLSVVLDYAHTPDALENVLATLRETLPKGRQLLCLFGCGGDRDRSKRPEMAAVAEKYADRIIVSSDNSRSERTEDIMEEIRQGFSPKGLAKSLFIADRREAIRTAVLTAPEGSAILLAGKGHETYQITGSEKHHFDEREITEEIFKTLC